MPLTPVPAYMHYLCTNACVFYSLYARSYSMCILYSNILGRQENTYNTEEKKPVKLWRVSTACLIHVTCSQPVQYVRYSYCVLCMCIN